MLEHHGDAQGSRFLRVADLHGFAIDQHGAFVGLDCAIDDFHQRGLASAVFTQDGVHLAWAHSQRYLVICYNCGVSLCNTHQLQTRRRIR